MGDMQDIGAAGLGADWVWVCGKKTESRASPHSLIWGTRWWEEPSAETHKTGGGAGLWEKR